MEEVCVKETKNTISSNEIKIASTIHLSFLGIAIVVSGQFTFWTLGLSIGIWSFFGCLVFIGSGYLCLSLCLAEMSAALPFSGGTYGLARVTLGAFPAFLIGFCEAGAYVFSAAIAVQVISEILIDICGIQNKYELVLDAFTYISIICVHRLNVSGATRFWRVILVLGLIVLALSIIYSVIAAPIYGDFQQNVTEQQQSVETTPFDWFRYMPLAALFFVGIEILPLSSGEAIKANKSIPKAIIITYCTALITSIAILFSCTSIAPGKEGLFSDLSPLSQGFSLLFKMSPNLSRIFTLISMYANVLSFSFAYVRLMTALEKSNLLVYCIPKRLWYNFNPKQKAISRGSVFGLLFHVAVYFLQPFLGRHFNLHWQFSAFIFGFFSYIGILCTYIVYKQQFHTLSKTYKSPLGVYGAFCGIFIFACALISSIGFQKDKGVGVLIAAILLAQGLLFYYFRGRKEQIYSSDEQAALFIAYVMRANNLKRNKMKHLSKSRYVVRAATGSKGQKSKSKSKSKATEPFVSDKTVAMYAHDTSHTQQGCDDILYIPDLEEQNDPPRRHSHSNSQPQLQCSPKQFSLYKYMFHSQSDRIVPSTTGTSTNTTQRVVVPQVVNIKDIAPPQIASVPRTDIDHNTGSDNNSDCSSGDHSSQDLLTYFAAMPDDFIPRDLDFDDGILESYHDAMVFFKSKCTSFKNNSQQREPHNLVKIEEGTGSGKIETETECKLDDV